MRVIKLEINTKIIKVSLDTDDLAKLKEKIVTRYADLKARPFNLSYKDPDGDCITIEHSDDLITAFMDFEESKQTIKFSIETSMEDLSSIQPGTEHDFDKDSFVGSLFGSQKGGFKPPKKEVSSGSDREFPRGNGKGNKNRHSRIEEEASVAQSRLNISPDSDSSSSSEDEISDDADMNYDETDDEPDDLDTSSLKLTNKNGNKMMLEEVLKKLEKSLTKKVLRELHIQKEWLRCIKKVIRKHLQTFVRKELQDQSYKRLIKRITKTVLRYCSSLIGKAKFNRQNLNDLLDTGFSEMSGKDESTVPMEIGDYFRKLIERIIQARISFGCDNPCCSKLKKCPKICRKINEILYQASPGSPSLKICRIICQDICQKVQGTSAKDRPLTLATEELLTLSNCCEACRTIDRYLRGTYPEFSESNNRIRAAVCDLLCARANHQCLAVCTEIKELLRRNFPEKSYQARRLGRIICAEYCEKHQDLIASGQPQTVIAEETDCCAGKQCMDACRHVCKMLRGTYPEFKDARIKVCRVMCDIYCRENRTCLRVERDILNYCKAQKLASGKIVKAVCDSYCAKLQHLVTCQQEPPTREATSSETICSSDCTSNCQKICSILMGTYPDMHDELQKIHGVICDIACYRTLPACCKGGRCLTICREIAREVKSSLTRFPVSKLTEVICENLCNQADELDKVDINLNDMSDYKVDDSIHPVITRVADLIGNSYPLRFEAKKVICDKLAELITQRRKNKPGDKSANTSFFGNNISFDEGFEQITHQDVLASAANTSKLGSTKTAANKHASKLYKSKFVRNVKINDGDEIYAGAQIHKVWCIENSGDCSWPEGCKLMTDGGANVSEVVNIPIVPVQNLAKGDQRFIAVSFDAPRRTGEFEVFFKIATVEGEKFGTRLHIRVNLIPAPNNQSMMGMVGMVQPNSMQGGNAINPNNYMGGGMINPAYAGGGSQNNSGYQNPGYGGSNPMMSQSWGGGQTAAMNNSMASNSSVNSSGMNNSVLSNHSGMNNSGYLNPNAGNNQYMNMGGAGMPGYGGFNQNNPGMYGGQNPGYGNQGGDGRNAMYPSPELSGQLNQGGYNQNMGVGNGNMHGPNNGGVAGGSGGGSGSSSSSNNKGQVDTKKRAIDFLKDSGYPESVIEAELNAANGDLNVVFERLLEGGGGNK